jgi:hypothetical protein
MGVVESPPRALSARRVAFVPALLIALVATLVVADGAFALGDPGPLNPKRLRPALAKLKDDRPASYFQWSRTGTRCHVRMAERKTPGWCQYGRTEGYTHTIAMVGASHVAHWLPAFDRIAKRQGWRILYMTVSSCDFGLKKGHKSRPRCTRIQRRMIPELLAARPDMVFVRANRRDSARPEAGRLPLWRRLHARRIPVLAMRDTPLFPSRPSDCVRRNLRQPLVCAQSRDAHLARTFSRGRAPGRVQILDLTHRYCDDTRCPAVIDGTLVWYDRHHLTRTFVLTMTDELEQAILAAWTPPAKSRANDRLIGRLLERRR